MDPLSRLGRKDKWFLGGGKGAIYAPPFPKHLLAPGFWDECYLADIRIPRLFTALITDEDGRPIRFESYHKGWRPDRLTIMHYSGDVVIREIRTVTEGNAWVSELELVTATRPLHVFLWSLLDVRPFGHGAPWSGVTDVTVAEDSVRARFETAWPAELEPDRTAVESERLDVSGAMLSPLPIFLEFGAGHDRESWTVNLAQRHDDSPRYELSVLPEKFLRGRLPGDFKHLVGTEPVDGMLHAVQHYLLEDRRPLVLACGAGLTPEAARRSLEDARADGVVERSQGAWRRYFGSVPQFSSSDEHLTNAYWYRWYGLRLNTVDLAGLPVRGNPHGATYAPFVTEGIGFFRNFVTYSAQAHLREVAWMHNPACASGILDNLVAVQREDGSFPGHNYSARPPRDFYHADFATGVALLHELHPGAVGKEHLGALRRYADYFLRHRTLSPDPAKSALYDVFDQNETGQEYMSRYQFASEDADKWASFRVSGVDATVYAIELFRLLARFRAGDSTYRAYHEGALTGLAERMFDPEAGFFCDVALDGRRSPARPATGLYAFLVGNLSDLLQRVPAERGLDRWFTSPDEFWLSAGFPATAASDPTFSAEGEWKEKRLNCPWNGRSWPMANSHLVDALANAARVEGCGRWRERAGEALLKAVRLLFHGGDAWRPNSYEHYDPVTGVPALYRGYDDYMHSWVVDLILRHAVGVRPGQGTIDPLPLPGVEWVACREIPHPKGWMHVRNGQVEIENGR
ncbi:MAG: MGH1-like glycoside hydrolase domain-containing protein [Fimbriimonas sp.]